MSQRSASALCVLLAIFCLPTVAAMFRIWVHQDAVQLGYALSAAERQRDQLHGELQRLHVDLAAQRSPGHLAQVARALGLRPPSVGQVLSGRSAPAHLARAELPRRGRGTGPRHDLR